MFGMRFGLHFVALAGFPSLSAFASVRPLEVARLPACAFADTEVSTNFAFVVERPEMTQPTSRLSHVFFLNRRQLDAAWNLVKVTRRGCGDVCELVSVRGRKPGFRLLIR